MIQNDSKRFKMIQNDSKWFKNDSKWFNMIQLNSNDFVPGRDDMARQDLWRSIWQQGSVIAT